MNANSNDRELNGREFNAGARISHRGRGQGARWLIAGCVLLAATGTAHATDAMRTAVVVNSQSTDSLTIANHYAALRLIPDASIVVLSDVPDKKSCQVDDFRQQILQPLVSELDRRKLAAQIDFIAYSADFPTAINVQTDLDKLPDRHKMFTPVGSINGLTHLYQFVLSKTHHYISPRSNYYARPDRQLLLTNPFVGTDRAIWDAAHADAKRGELESAVRKAEALLKKHPFQWPLLFHMAAWLAEADRPDGAVQAVAMLVKGGEAYRNELDQLRALDALATDERYLKLLEQIPVAPPARLAATPFSARLSYGLNALPVGELEQGLRYLPSTVLAVTHEGGTTLAEAIEILQRAATADGMGEAAEFYFSDSSDVRAKTRMPLVPAAAEILRELGHEVVIEQDPLPRSRERLMGAMLGSATYDWPAAGNTVLPGAILENLTSTSGAVHRADSQTPMIELLRGGAAGTSGTVTEPYSLTFKFPTPLLYAYYAQGCSLAEAFYLSVESPYQLLIIGDPLCRPFGDEHTEAMSLEVLAEDDELVQVGVKFWRGAAAARARLQELELFVDGRLVNVVPLTDKLNLQKEKLLPGKHQLTVAAVSRHPLRLKTLQSLSIDGPNTAQPPSLQARFDSGGSAGGVITATLAGAGASKLAIRHLGRRIAETDQAEATLKLPITQIGYGPVRLIPEALIGENWISGTPIMIDVPLP